MWTDWKHLYSEIKHYCKNTFINIDLDDDDGEKEKDIYNEMELYEVHIFPHLYSILEYGAILAFLWVSKVITYVKIYLMNISESPIILEYIQYGKELFYKTKTEPKNNWISICSIKNHRLNEMFIEETQYKNEAVPKPDWLLYNELYENALSNYESGLFVMKIQNQYIYRNIIKPDSKKNALYHILLSQIRFILVEYRHPKLQNPIYLDIPKTAYIKGNEILSKTHVLRCLEYQNETRFFAETYTLHIMDNNLKEFVIFPNQYCRLHFDKYEVLEE